MSDNTDERDAQVDRLLHDAEHAESGSKFAWSMGHKEAARDLAEKYDRLFAEALKLDPGRLAPAWAEHTKWEERN